MGASVIAVSAAPGAGSGRGAFARFRAGGSVTLLLRGVILLANVFDVHRGGRERHLQRLQILHHDPAHGQVAEPLVVGGDDEPRRGGESVAPGQRVLVGRRVVGPVGALPVVGLADFPLLGRIVEPLLEPFQLLLFGDVKEEFEDVGSALDQTALERVDPIVPGGPRRGGGPGYGPGRLTRPRSATG